MQVTDNPPKGTPIDIWQRFQRLKKRNKELSTVEIDARKRCRFEAKTSEKAGGLEPDDQSSERLKPHGARSSTSTDWSEVTSYLDVNSHLKGTDKQQESHLEQEMNKAISRGDLDLADRLSDRLAKRAFGKRVTEAFDAKKYSEKKQKEEADAKAKRRRKLNWGFTEKQRWETKGNM